MQLWLDVRFQRLFQLWRRSSDTCAGCSGTDDNVNTAVRATNHGDGNGLGADNPLLTVWHYLIIRGYQDGQEKQRHPFRAFPAMDERRRGLQMNVCRSVLPVERMPR